MQAVEDFLRKKWYFVVGAILLLVATIHWLNTPHQDSSERPLPKKEQQQLTKHEKELAKEVERLKKLAINPDSVSLRAYRQGVRDATEAENLHKQTNQHAPSPTRSATADELQSILTNYGDKNTRSKSTAHH